MSKKSIPSCLACGKQGHRAMTGPPPWRPFICPLSEHPEWWGKLGVRREHDLTCSECGWANFVYANGHHYSREGVRGYRCANPNCGAIKPEREEEAQ